MVNIGEMKELLTLEYLNSIPSYKGDLGEILAIDHFEKINQGFIHVNSSIWSYPPKMKEVNAKRPDFYLIPMNESVTVIDVKYHQLNENMDFIIEKDEMIKYLELHQFLMNLHGKSATESDYIDIRFLVIPSITQGNAFANVSLTEIANNRIDTEKTFPGNKSFTITRFIVSVKDRLIKLGTKNEPYTMD